MAKDNRTDEQRDRDLIQARIEATRFEARAKEYLDAVDAWNQLEEKYKNRGAAWDWNNPEYKAYMREGRDLPSLPPLNAAVKRASMDLTKALAKYRNG